MNGMYDVITIGTATRDVFLLSPFFKVLRDPAHLKRIGFVTGEAECFALGSKVEVDGLVFATGGGATNAAVTFARQGFRTAAFVGIGDDASGREITSELKREGVTPFAVVHRGTPSAYATILLSRTGERTILAYRNPKDVLRTAQIPFGKLTARWAYLVPGNMAFATLRTLIASLRRRGTAIAVNPSRHFIGFGRARTRALLTAAAVVIVNREEAALLTGGDYGDAYGLAQKLHGMGRGVVVVTDGPRGVMVADRARIYRAGAFRERKLVDRTGAGDAFGSGFIAGLLARRVDMEKPLAREDVEYAVRLASANATSVVERIGTKEGILTRRAFLHERRWQAFPISVREA